MKKWLVPGMILAIAAILLGFSSHIKTRISERNTVLGTRARLETEAKKASAWRVLGASEKLMSITILEKLDEFSKDVATWGKGERDAVALLLRAKLFEANFRRAELYLLRAGNLLRADEHHPTGKAYIETAKKFYDRIEKLMDAGIPDRPNDPQGNARLNYLKGVYYYRLLVFVKNPKEEAGRVNELVGLSAHHLSAVFQYIPKDPDAELALEILQKKAKEMGAGGDSPDDKMQLKLLPSPGKPGQDRSFAIEGSEEGRN